MARPGLGKTITKHFMRNENIFPALNRGLLKEMDHAQSCIAGSYIPPVNVL